MEINLNIYGKDKQIAKTHTVEGYDLMLGTIEDFMEVVDVEHLDDPVAVSKMIMNGYKQVKPLLKDVFPELTDEEFRGIRLSELAGVMINIGRAALENLSILKQGNSQRA